MTTYLRKQTISEITGYISTVNSSDTPLVAAAVFTGTSESIENFADIKVSVYSDQAGSISIQQSSDGTNWDITDDYNVPATTGKTYSINPVGAFFRIVYTNGAVDQTSFRLQTIFKSVYAKPSSHRIQDSISDDDDAELIKAVITGEDESGTFRNARVGLAGRLETVNQQYEYAVAEGDILNHYTLLKFGTRTSVVAATQSTIWEGPTDLYVYMSTAQQLKISSTDANDTVAGTGARTLYLEGVDGTYAEINETINLNGVGVVTTVNSYLRVYRANVVTCGTSYTNLGIISILDNASAVTQAIINIGDAQTLHGMFTVPSGRTLYITQGTFSTDSNKGARISLFTRQLDGGTLYPWRIKYRSFTFGGNENYPFKVPIVLPEKTDVEVRVTTPASAGTTSCGATFEGWYEVN